MYLYLTSLSLSLLNLTFISLPLPLILLCTFTSLYQVQPKFFIYQRTACLKHPFTSTQYYPELPSYGYVLVLFYLDLCRRLLGFYSTAQFTQPMVVKALILNLLLVQVSHQ